MQITFSESDKEKMIESFQQVIEQAYIQGVEAGKQSHSIPYHMTKQDVADFFQVSLASVENIIRMDGFPKSKVIRARYPRDLVIKWAHENSESYYLYKRSRAKAI